MRHLQWCFLEPRVLTPLTSAASSPSQFYHSLDQSSSFLELHTTVHQPMVNLLLAVTGSVATVRLVKLIGEIRKQCDNHNLTVDIRVIATGPSLHFVSRDEIAATQVQLFTDEDEWSSWKTLGDPVMHIELRKWADVMLIAPLDANTLAKAANGLCDNLVTCVLRAWDVSKPLCVAPAMNTCMWNHPMTEEHIARVSRFGYKVIPPISKKLACADVGIGAMAECEQIASILVAQMISYL